jgi:hypothetical protein
VETGLIPDLSTRQHDTTVCQDCYTQRREEQGKCNPAHADGFVAVWDLARRGYSVSLVSGALVVRDYGGSWVAGTRCNTENMEAAAEAILLVWRQVRISERLTRENARALRVEENALVEGVWRRLLDDGKVPACDE